MRSYEFTAIDYANAIQRGMVRAWTKEQAASQLARNRLSVVTLVKATSPDSRLDWLKRGVSRMDKIVFTRNLMTMMRAGLTFTDALASAREQTDRPFLRKIIRDAEKSVMAGQTFSSVLDRYPRTFSSVYRAMIRIGERSGKLVDVLTFLTHQMEGDYRLLRKIRNALVYPTLILVTMIIMVVMMMLFVIPKIASVYNESSVRMPLMTRGLIRASEFVVTDWMYLLGGVIVVVTGFVLLVIRSRGFRGWIHRRMIAAPGVGLIIKKLNLAVVSRSLGMMMRSGLSIDDALELAAPAASTVPYQDAVTAAAPFVRRGVGLSDILKGNPDLFLPVFQKMIATGEGTGNLDDMFEHVARYYDEDVDHWTANVSSYIEPVLLLLTGIVVGGIAVAVLYPLWNFANII
ncbi:MAG: type II secretion system F family protein [Candidatus Kerfeldbacteria bacterium]|nr:type II secretion system F family protein [Candidatus Kerfeldbacteria bacterium]